MNELEQLYREYGAELTRKIQRVFGLGPPDPEELMQETFSKMLTNDNVEGIEYPKAYLFRSAINLGLNYQSRYKNTQSFIDDALESVDIPVCPEGSPEDIYNFNQRVVSLSNAVDQLSDKQKELIRRNRIHGETYEQIKKTTGWSLADISRQLREAVATIALESH